MKNDKRPWVLNHVEDRLRTYGDGYRPGRCEECGKSGLRIVHVISRDNPEEVKRVGGCCAANMVKGYDAMGQQRKMKNQYARASRIPHRNGWDESQSGNQTIVIKGCWLTVFPDKKNRSRFKFSITRNQKTHFSKSSYESIFEAKSAAGWMFADLAGWLEDDKLADEKRDVPEDEYDDFPDDDYDDD